MGQFSSSPNLSSRKEIRIIINGLYGSGKKSILKKLELKAKETPGTVGDQLMTATCNNIQVVSWDVGGRCYSRALARRYYEKGVDAILIVVDSSEQYFISHMRVMLDMIMDEESLKDAIFLILANKQDLPGAQNVEKVSQELDFAALSKSHVAKIMGCSAETGEGLQEAMDWLAGKLEEKKEREPVETKETGKQGKKSRSLISCVKNGFQAFKALLPKAA